MMMLYGTVGTRDVTLANDDDANVNMDFGDITLAHDDDTKCL